jgi:hypothetical protein
MAALRKFDEGTSANALFFFQKLVPKCPIHRQAMWDRDGPHIEASEYIHILVPHRPPHCMHDLSAPPPPSPPTTTTKPNDVEGHA